MNFTDPKSGVSEDIIIRLIEDSNVENLTDTQRNVSLIFDEMKIKSGLIYRRSTGKLGGFTEMGEVKEEIQLFQMRCDGASPNRKFFRMNAVEDNCTWYVFDVNRKIFIFFDVPHLLKTTRNNHSETETQEIYMLMDRISVGCI